MNRHEFYQLLPDADRQAVINKMAALQKTANQPRFSAFRLACEDIERENLPCKVEVQDGVVYFLPETPLSPAMQQTLEERLRLFCPWKKGPFNICGVEIDAEWRSDLKWERFAPHLDQLEGKIVADIGCNNGYFMYRMLEQNPKFVLGLEPYAKHWYSFKLMQALAPQENLSLDLLGVEDMGYFSGVFDAVFCMGILYHHTDPVDLLRRIYQALRPGGQLIVECQGIIHDLPLALVPAKRYAQARGIWNLPSRPCLENWLHRCQFRELNLVFEDYLSPSEQRTTGWAPVKSLSDFLDPSDAKLTIEGYPAPARIYIVARK